MLSVDEWKKFNEEFHSEKNELICKLDRINSADTEFYNTCEKILCFVNNAENMFLNGNVEDKRFITKLLLSNSSYYNGKLDIVLHPIFDTLLRLSQEHKQAKQHIEPSETMAIQQKTASEETVFKNGGTDEARTRDLLRDS